ncbi:MAG: Fic family protein [Chitinispirillales bacterium]|jgi:cell filamentation protein|nr:Fic family protein [Chitinispirillales bacterium]
MRNDYEYIDPDHAYTDPQTGVLRNLADITDPSDLLFFESTAVIKRAKELELRPLTVHGAKTLLEIHRYLFQDVYHWAGQKRTVEISKQNKPFFLTAYFDNGFAYIDTLITEYRKITRTDKPKLAEQLAILLDNINHLHPFREGNGRTQREFIRLLALEKGYTLNLNPSDNIDVYERYMSGTIDGDVVGLAAMILELLKD